MTIKSRGMTSFRNNWTEWLRRELQGLVPHTLCLSWLSLVWLLWQGGFVHSMVPTASGLHQPVSNPNRKTVSFQIPGQDIHMPIFQSITVAGRWMGYSHCPGTGGMPIRGFSRWGQSSCTHELGIEEGLLLHRKTECWPRREWCWEGHNRHSLGFPWMAV